MTVTCEPFLSHERELPELRDRLQLRLEQLLPQLSEHDPVSAAMREGVLVPGKRIRPLLLLLAARDLGCDRAHPGLVDLACAVELIHAASLIFDDMPCMDNALERRGQPTIHHAYGQDVAILAGIALLSRAFGVAATATGLSDACRNQVVAELSIAVGIQGLALGQFKDLRESSAPRSAVDIATTNDLKTSMLFGATLQLAALAAGSSAAVREKLRSFAKDLGQAFQLLDDLSDRHVGTGKDCNKDAGKSTMIAVIGADAVRQRLDGHLRSAEAHFTWACGEGHVTPRFMHAWFNQQLAIFSNDL